MHLVGVLALCSAGFDSRADTPGRTVAGKVSFVSSAVVTNQNAESGHTKAFQARGTDGGAVEIGRKKE